MSFLVRKLDDTVKRERAARAKTDLRNGELKNEVANLRLKCAR